MTRETIQECGIVPVVTIGHAEEAVPVAEALLSGGVKVIEITFRTEEAEEALRSITSEVPGILAGAGTVRTVDQLERALDAGARFVVTPGFNRRIVELAVKRHMPIYPGVVTPGEIETVSEYGIETMKFFPAETAGGAAALKALAGPYGDIRFIPTGGIGEHNFEDYLRLANVIAVGGSWLTKPDESGRLDYELIRSRAAEAAKKTASVRGAQR